MLKIKTPKSGKAKREIEKRAPKLVSVPQFALTFLNFILHLFSKNELVYSFSFSLKYVLFRLKVGRKL